MAGTTRKYQEYTLTNEEIEIVVNTRDKLKTWERCLTVWRE